jgi:hypothetical protein
MPESWFNIINKLVWQQQLKNPLRKKLLKRSLLQKSQKTKENKEINTITIMVNNIQPSVPGFQVMLDGQLASLYGVETRALNQAVKRNIERFPEEFMFQLNTVDLENLKSQIVISSLNRPKGSR